MMKLKVWQLCILLVGVAVGAVPVFALSTKWDLAELIGSSDAICAGTALDNRAFEDPDGDIHTATRFSVAQGFKGTFGETVRIQHPGGRLNGRGMDCCGQPNFQAQEKYLLFLRIRPDGTLGCSRSMALANPSAPALLQTLQEQAAALAETGADLSSLPEDVEMVAEAAAAYSVLPSGYHYTSRFLQGDRGEPIEYVVDMDLLPVGITTAQALDAVEKAFAAWTAETSLTFRFAGIESFGKKAASTTVANAHPNQICIQLHDKYNHITESNQVGDGGRTYTWYTWTYGGTGGRVGTNEFDRTTFGYVVLEHAASVLSDTNTLAATLCHELGHVLSLGHSSEMEDESDPALAEATMYYMIHHDGRGAVLAPWDIGNAQTIYPAGNTPPYGYDRVLRILYANGPQATYGSGVNQAKVEAFDRQGVATVHVLDSTAINGTFSLVGGDTVLFTPYGWFGSADSPETPAGAYYDSCMVRITDDANNGSPPVQVKVIQLLADETGDRLADSWVAKYGVSGGAAFDHDHDGYSNLDEWFLNTDPTNPVSRFETSISSAGLTWNSRTNDLYQILSATNLADGFSPDGSPVRATSDHELLPITDAAHKFYRVQRLP